MIKKKENAFLNTAKIKCVNKNCVGPYCPTKDTPACHLCRRYMQEGGRIKKHSCLCGFKTRCIRELYDHIHVVHAGDKEHELNCRCAH